MYLKMLSNNLDLNFSIFSIFAKFLNNFIFKQAVARIKPAGRVYTARTNVGFKCNKKSSETIFRLSDDLCQILSAAAQCQP